MTVHKKLMDVRIALHAMPLKKSGFNDFSKYHYFELGDFLPQTLTLFHQHNLCGVVTFDVDRATLRLTDLDDGTTLDICSPMAEAALKGAHAIQNMGAVHTYMRRYLWMLATELTENDLLDRTYDKNAEAKAVKEVKRPPAVMEGKKAPWQIKVKLSPEGDLADWLKIIEEACDLVLPIAQTKEDVMSIFTVNKELFNELKKQDMDFFTALMAKFSEAKAKLPEKEKK